MKPIPLLATMGATKICPMVPEWQLVNFHTFMYISQKKWRDFGTAVQLLAYEWSVVLLSILYEEKNAIYPE